LKALINILTAILALILAASYFQSPTGVPGMEISGNGDSSFASEEIPLKDSDGDGFNEWVIDTSNVTPEIYLTDYKIPG